MIRHISRSTLSWQIEVELLVMYSQTSEDTEWCEQSRRVDERKDTEHNNVPNLGGAYGRVVLAASPWSGTIH